MKNKTNTPTVGVMPMDEVKKLDAGALTTKFVSDSTVSRVAYIGCAKALVALLVILGGDIKAAKTRLLKAGAKESDIRNGRQLSLVWDEFVEPGHLTEAQFNELRYLDAIALRTVAASRGTEVAVANLADMEEIHHLAEHGITRAQSADKADREAKKLAEAHTVAAAAKAANVATPAVVSPVQATASTSEGAPANVPSNPDAATVTAATAPVVETPAAPVATAPSKIIKLVKPPIAEFGKACDTLRAIVESIVKNPQTTPAEMDLVVANMVELAKFAADTAAAASPAVAVAA